MLQISHWTICKDTSLCSWQGPGTLLVENTKVTPLLVRAEVALLVDGRRQCASSVACERVHGVSGWRGAERQWGCSHSANGRGRVQCISQSQGAHAESMRSTPASTACTISSAHIKNRAAHGRKHKRGSIASARAVAGGRKQGGTCIGAQAVTHTQAPRPTWVACDGHVPQLVPREGFLAGTRTHSTEYSQRANSSSRHRANSTV